MNCGRNVYFLEAGSDIDEELGNPQCNSMELMPGGAFGPSFGFQLIELGISTSLNSGRLGNGLHVFPFFGVLFLIVSSLDLEGL